MRVSRKWRVICLNLFTFPSEIVTCLDKTLRISFVPDNVNVVYKLTCITNYHYCYYKASLSAIFLRQN